MQSFKQALMEIMNNLLYLIYVYWTYFSDIHCSLFNDHRNKYNSLFRFKTGPSGKFQIKNTISFKNLTIVYSLGLFFAAFIQGIIMISITMSLLYAVQRILHYRANFAIPPLPKTAEIGLGSLPYLLFDT